MDFSYIRVTVVNDHKVYTDISAMFSKQKEIANILNLITSKLFIFGTFL